MIERLQISNLRNLTHVNMHTAACNVLIGANGSGKTSLLEAIFLLSRGKSFRHHQPKRYIQHHQHTATVHARLSDGNTLAIQKQADATTLLRLNQSTVYNQSILTEQLPTLLIDPSSMDMLEQGSASRRQLLDWLVFHMKQGFHPQWLAYQRLLKQRNSLLKKSKHLTHVQLAELRSWDKGLGNHAALIHHYRQHVFTKWQPYFADSIAQLLPSYAEQLSLSYHAGYDTDVALEVQLGERLEQDLQLGYTRIGNHRADIHVHWRSNDTVATNDTMLPDKLPAGSGSKQVVADPLPMLKEQAANVLSRGEKKLLITALRLSQLPLLLQTAITTQVSTNENERVLTATPVVLLDDITAELDERAIEILLSTLAKLPCQVFMSSLTADVTPLVNDLWSNPMMFHVKQGQVLPF
ncbi:DNA replication/repair protein RecF [Psychrobacter sp. HII-4]|uniref:DNA replication/repair protein RecF n=1 Tax=Psychrobacter sp. HII-4 TaxID=1569264 RepID=UPI001917C164|nr:DNA replication and repair protein RecF [Psychrobacter sp. HII-4]